MTNPKPKLKGDRSGWKIQSVEAMMANNPKMSSADRSKLREWAEKLFAGVDEKEEDNDDK
jgi:hypothetical protein